MAGDFVHLHCHSEYSLLDGLGRVGDLLDAASQAGMPALALTDHGTMFGAVEFYSQAKQRQIKPIVGCEVYVADRGLDERAGPEARNYHLVLLAENEVGYRNLIRLTTEAHLRGFYRKPRVDHQLLRAHADGLVCLSGCASSELAAVISTGDLSAAEEKADWYAQTFPGRYYLELQYHELEIQRTINQGIVHLSHKLGLPLVATNDVHYVRDRHAYTHEVLLCIQTQTTMSDPKRMRFETQEFYLKSPEQMRALFSEYPSATANTLEIAERCNVELSFGRPQLPRFETPDGQTSRAYLRALCEEGVRRRYPEAPQAVRDRLDYELSIIESTGFVDYFLLVYDVIRFARERGIGVGPGRGSAAGSIVAYVLYVTGVDPIAHGLSFERFLNPERVTMPDMDLDFADDRRDEVIRYVTDKYGRERVAQIITFGTIRPRAGVRDVGRVMGLSYGDVDRVAKLIPFTCNSVDRARDEVPELQHLYEEDPAITRLLDTVRDLDGVARHASTHAAGVVISRDPLSDHVPLYKVPKSDQVTTQYAMTSIEKIGLLKMDFLGLRTLTILQRTRELVRHTTGADLVLEDISLDDPSIYELLGSGDTFGVFQVDGAGMRKLLRELRPTEFNHMVAVEALYRPGPMEQIPEFVARKTGVKEVRYDHPLLREVLEETFGILVYQDQVMRLAARIAGYSLGEADLLRRAMGKKKPEELAAHRTDFVERASKLGTDSATAERLFDIIEPFAGYAFPKAHAAAYAVITCQTAYLKAKYPRQYMTALLSAERENAERVSEAVTECRRMGIAILPPDINRSEADFSLEEEGIRFGLSAVKHLGSAAVETILAARLGGGPFQSVEDLCARVDWSVVNKRALESLAKSGALDSLNVERGRVVAGLDRIVSFGLQLHRAAAVGQTSLFGDVEMSSVLLQLPIVDPATVDQKLSWERELLGMYVSPHPLSEAERRFPDLHVETVSVVSSDPENRRLSVGGMIQGFRSFSTKDGRPMGSFRLDDLQSSLEVVVFSRTFEQVRSKLSDGEIVVVDGKLDGSDGRLRVLADGIWAIDEAAARPAPNGGNGKKNGGNGNGRTARPGNGESVPAGPPPVDTGRRITVEIGRSDDRTADIERIVAVYQALQRYRGGDTVEIVVRNGSRRKSIPLPSDRVGYCPELAEELSAILPPESVSVHDPTPADPSIA